MSSSNTPFPLEGRMRVTPEQSRVLQERLLREKYSWHPGDSRILFTNECYIIWNDNQSINYSNDSDGDYFEYHPHAEYQFSDLFPEHKEEPFDIAGGIVDIITILKNTRDAELVKKVLEMIKK